MPRKLSLFLYFAGALLICLLTFIKGFYVLNTESNDDSLISPGPYSEVGVYVINLDRSRTRYEYILPNVKALNYKINRISAVDGAKLSKQAIEEYTDLAEYRNYLGHYPKPGTIGCSLSHIKVWHDFLESNYQYALVLEDDISFDPKLLRSTIEKLTENNTLWDMTSFELNHRGMPLPIKHFADPKQDLSVYLFEVTHSGAYIMNRKAAQSLLAKALPIKMPIDHFFTRSWEFDLVFTGIEPRIVMQTFGDSEINKTKHVMTNNDQSPPPMVSIRKSIYKTKSCIIRLLYNLSIYLNLSHN